MRNQTVMIRLAIAGLTCLIGCLNGTPLRPTILAAQEVVFSFPEGHARLKRVSPRQFQNAGHAMVWMVQDKHIQKELEIVESQSTELKQAILEESEKRRMQSLSKGEDPPKASPVQDNRDALEPLRKRIHDILLPHQAEKLDSIYCWSVFRYQGIAVLARNVADQSGVTLTTVEEKAIEEAARRLDKELLDVAMDEYRSLLERTSEQFPGFRDYLMAFGNSASPVSLDVLFADGLAMEELSLGDLGDSLTALIRADRRGSFLPFHNLHVESVPDGNSAWAEALSLLGIPDVDSGGLLSADQRTAIEILRASASDEFRKIAIEYANQLEANPSEAKRAMLDAKTRLDQKSMKYLESEILLPHQVKWLVDALRQRLIHSYGLLGILLITAGNDGKENNVPDQDEIREFLEKEIVVLRVKVTKEFHRNVGQQVDELPESVRSEVRQRLGEPPDYLLPILSILDQRVGATSERGPVSSR